jgi:signal transduction histidine kinase
VSGEDRSALLGQAQPIVGMPHRVERGIVTAMPSADGRYRFLMVVTTTFDPWSFAPYYSPVLLLVALLCWLLAVSLASPLRKLAHAVEQFGRGDLAVRVNSRRGDEIGALARAFDVMADRIQTLMTAERRLLQDVSHELRSPLARLSFAAELTRTATDRDAAAARLQKEVGRLDRLVGALLQVTRVEGDPLANQTDVISLDELLREVVDDCGMEAVTRAIRIEYKAEANATVFGDRELLRRAVENLIFNAIRYAPLETMVQVTLQSNGGTAKVSVRDYGEGVPEELLEKIFSPFFRVDASRDSSTGGVGLGLAIAQRAVQLHHGEVSARNAAPGLQVDIRIPLYVAPAQ